MPPGTASTSTWHTRRFRQTDLGVFSRKKREKGRGPTDLRLFFATDVHGSERCFRKFLNAGKFYDVQHLILGGDITGKVLIPIVRTPRGWSAHYHDHEYIDIDDAEKAELETRIRDNGQYPVTGERDELEALADETHRDTVFTQVVAESIERWVASVTATIGTSAADAARRTARSSADGSPSRM